jgi:curli biogenesis system outer membrane secretion channel CsgG
LPVRRNDIKKLVLLILCCLVLGSAGSAFAVEKMNIGVLRFTNNTQAYWWSNSTATELQDMLITELADNKIFHVLERQELYSLLEQKFTEAILSDARTTKLKPGKIKGIRYFIVATVSAFEENTNVSNNVINFFSRSSGEGQNKAYVVIDLKVVDKEAGAIIDSRSISATSSPNSHAGNVVKFYGSLIRREKTPVGKAIRNCIIEVTEYLKCSLITKDKECVKKYEAMEAKRKEKNKAVIQIHD